MWFVFTLKSMQCHMCGADSCKECTPLVQCLYCTESTYGKYCIEHEMENKHHHRVSRRERTDMSELVAETECEFYMDTFIAYIVNWLK